MNRKAAQKALQQMHDTRTVTNQSIIAWYSCFANQARQQETRFPPLNPKVSPIDLLLTAGLWMELTDQGQCELPFPFDYQSSLSLPDPEGPEPKMQMPLLARRVLVAMWLGLGAAFVFGKLSALAQYPAWILPLGYMACFVVLFLCYYRNGTSVPIQSIRPGAPLHTAALRVIEWSRRQTPDVAAAT